MEETPASAVSSSQGQAERFELVQALSRGTVGSVFKANDKKLNRIVALRIVDLPDWVEDPKVMLQKVLTEARNASMLDHPHIVRLFGGGHKELKVSLVWEFIEGPSLRDILGKGVPLNEVFSIGKQLLSALEYANSKGVFHHCLNPCNLKMQTGGVLKVLDFGLLPERHVVSPIPAKRLENEHYLSPEQIRQKPIDSSTNIFHAATILYELFTSRNPFAGKHLAEVDRNITDLHPTPLSKAHARVPEEVSKVVLKGLAKNPQDRYASYQEFIAALELAKSGARQVAVNPTAAAATPAQTATGAAPAPATKSMASSDPAKISKAAAVPPKEAAKPAISVASVLNHIQWQYMVLGLILLAMFAGVFHFLTNRQAAVSEVVEVKSPQEVQPQDAASTSADSQMVIPSIPAESSAASAENQETTDIQSMATVKRRAARGVGELSISSVPSGAEIELDGNPMGSTPQTIDSVPAGSHRVVLNKEGFSSEARVVNISAEHLATVSVRLPLIRSVVNINATPSGASILVDGANTGRVSPAELFLEHGAHTITVHEDGYLDASVNMTLKSGEDYTFSPELKPLGRADTIKVVGGGIKKIFGGLSGNVARVQIKTEPKGANVIINGMRLEKRTPVELELDRGSYIVVLDMPGFKPVQKTVTVGSGQRLQIEEQLQNAAR